MQRSPRRTVDRAGAANMRKPAANARRAAGAAARPPRVDRRVPARQAKMRKNGAAAKATAKPAATRSGRAVDRPIDRVARRGTEGDTATGASRGKYVYCVIEAQEPMRFGPIGIGGDPSDVYTVH